MFLSDHSVSSKGGGRILPPSDVSPTEKHAIVTKVKDINLAITRKILSYRLWKNYERNEIN